jgi:hypothetical protein
MKAMHDKGTVKQAMDSFRAGYSKLEEADPENPEMGYVLRSMGELEEALDCYLESFDKVPTATFDRAPWDLKRNQILAERDGETVLVCRDVSPENAKLILAAPLFAYLLFRVLRAIESGSQEQLVSIMVEIPPVLKEAGISV